MERKEKLRNAKFYFFPKLCVLFWDVCPRTMAMAAMKMVRSSGVFRGGLSNVEMSAGSRGCSLYKKSSFCVLTSKVRPHNRRYASP